MTTTSEAHAIVADNENKIKRMQATIAEIDRTSRSGSRIGKIELINPLPTMSALPPKADISASHLHVCFGPQAEVLADLFQFVEQCLCGC
jgi:hypothetical protein